MKTTKLKVFKNMAFVPLLLVFPLTSLTFFNASSFTVQKMANFHQMLLLQKHMLSHVCNHVSFLRATARTAQRFATCDINVVSFNKIEKMQLLVEVYN